MEPWTLENGVSSGESGTFVLPSDIAILKLCLVNTVALYNFKISLRARSYRKQLATQRKL